MNHLFVMRAFGICASLFFVWCGLRYAGLMTKGPRRFLYRSLIVISAAFFIYVNLTVRFPNPWLLLTISMIFLASTHAWKRMRTNNPAPLLNLQRLAGGPTKRDVNREGEEKSLRGKELDFSPKKG